LQRAAAWQIVERILAPVPLSDLAAHLAVGGAAELTRGRTVTVPHFRTFYDRDDLERAFKHAYEALGPVGRAEGQPLAPSELDAAWEWNAVHGPTLVSEEQWQARKARITDDASVQGLGARSRVLYSHSFASHVLERYHTVLRNCSGEHAVQDGSRVPCLGSEPGPEAVVIKTEWIAGDETAPLAHYRTDADALDAQLAQGEWTSVGDVRPQPGSIYTVRVTRRAAASPQFRLVGLHVATKELRDWFWVSLFWSPDPDSDFGADRPDAIRRLGGPWSHYKMCSAVEFDVGDSEDGGVERAPGEGPSAGEPPLAESLQAALRVVRARLGTDSWCSNPYIERGRNNARTNCIGCHQHGGAERSLGSDTILADEARFPRESRRRVRESFPADYIFSLTSPSAGVVDSFRQEVQYWRGRDGQASGP
jgi:mono/diheme cytochrome c family protein